jgi:hypothetical protein
MQNGRTTLQDTVSDFISKGAMGVRFFLRRALKKSRTGFRVRIEDFFVNNSHQAKRSQIRLFDPPKTGSFEFAVKRDVELSKKCC